MDKRLLIIKYLNKLFFLVVACLLAVSLYFLYNNFYLTLTRAKMIPMLQEQVSPNMLNIKLWQKVVENINYKKTSILGDPLNLPKNPFTEITIGNSE